MTKRTDKELGAQQRAYGLLEIKAIDEEKREITGIASTPTPDRMDDIVEPDGAEYTLPIPFLWQHNSREAAIGHVIAAKPNKNGIPVTIRIERAGPDDSPKLKEQLDYAWSAIKKKLVRGLSIGFQPTEWAEIKGSFGYRYTKWDWLELSAVTIPANADCSINAIKSADQTLRAALGAKQKKAVRLDTTPNPGASGSTAGKEKGTSEVKKSIKEQIAAFEAKRAANDARMQELMTAASEKGETLDEAGAQEYDTLGAEVKQIDAHLVRLKELEQANIAKAKAATQQDGEDPARASIARIPARTIQVESNLPKGIAFTRFVKAMAMARGNVMQAYEIAKANEKWNQETPHVATCLKTAVSGGTTTGAAWFDDVVYNQNLVAEFIEYLRPATIIGRLGLRNVPFNVRVGSQTSGSTAYWTGEGKPAPVSKLQSDNVSLQIAKATGLVVLTEELVRSSAPSAEMLVRNDLRDTIAAFLDVQFIDPNFGPVTATGAPGSVTYGVTPVTPTGTTAAALRNDMKTLLDTYFTANLNPQGAIWVMSPSIATQIGLITTSGLPQFPGLGMDGGSLGGIPVITSMSAFIAGSPDYAHMMVLLLPREIFLADEGGLEIDASREAALQMDDAPTNESAAPTATTMVSMFQTGSVAIKAVRFINWKKRRSTAVAYIRTAAYKDA